MSGLYSTNHVRNMFKLGESSYKTIRNIMIDEGILRRSQRINDELVEVIAEAVEVQRATGLYWRAALAEPIAKYKKNMKSEDQNMKRTTISQSEIKLHDVLFSDSSDQQANTLFAEKCGMHFDGASESFMEYTEQFNAVMDFWKNLGYEEFSNALAVLQDTFIKAAAFDFSVENGLSGE